ncbi:uncharacterized protein LOC132257740 [Phlebotomus argentipes]|uniref:uncharacterized protein LOC132257740 n=1 Tax=Phlebotomus argentipes TaxID=94469 RepID=UPI0028937869|nr:uncharacterized protein LOC132257740 [Phlebotomus argentipes]
MAAASAGVKGQGGPLTGSGGAPGKGQMLQRQIHCHSQTQDPSPTWVRLITSGDIIYVSPSGEALKSIEQVKEYLLRPGTCKCGLPCPLRPDLYFNFDPKSQCHLETMPRIPGACLHQARLRQEVDVKTHYQGVSGSFPMDNKLSNLTLSRAPPWRKSAPVNQEFERVPPLHPQQRDNNQPPWQEEKRLQRTRNVANASAAKKRPNFKDDPTGYLDHQTAILHSSILNVHSPDLSQFDAQQEEIPEPQTTLKRQIVRQQVPQMIQMDGQMMIQQSGQKIVINDQIPGQTVTHLPNGMVQIHQNTADGSLGKMVRKETLICAASQESPVSSSTAFYGSENTGTSPSELRQPVQGGMITTSNDMPSSSSPELYPRAVASGHTVAKNTITSVLAGKAATTTCTSQVGRLETTAPQFISTAPGQSYAGGQIQQNQLIMTSSGQFLVMPTNQGGQQSAPKVVINNPHVVNTGQQIVNGSLLSGNIEIVNGQEQTSTRTTGNVVIQGGQNLIPAGQNIISNAGNSFIVNSGTAGQVQSVILNNSNMIPAGGMSPATGKVIQNGGSVNQLINNGTMVLNTLPSGFVVQQPAQNFATSTVALDGGVVDTTGATTYLQQRTVLLSPSEVKRKVKKRKSMSSPQNVSPQISPQLQMVGAPHYTAAQQPPYQIGGQLSQLTIVPAGKGATTSAPAPQQQIIVHQNGQTILQPVNLIGQQLLVPAGLVVTPAPTETLLQIQNMPQNLITPPQQMVLRAPSPQGGKAFLSPNSAAQQFIVSGNGQVSPLGQIYSTPAAGTMGLMVPQTSQNQTFVQQNTTIVQQQTTLLGANGQKQSMDMEEQHQALQGTSSPPDTTTYSPQSPDRPASERSVESDSNMVQCVSSSEPDSMISPMVDGMESQLGHHHHQHHQHQEFRSGQQNFQQHQHVFKPSDAKVRRLQSSSIGIPVYRNPSKMKMSDLSGHPQ